MSRNPGSRGAGIREVRAWGWCGVLAAALLTLTRLAHAGGAITGIAPACAPVGAAVVLSGRGFGAENVFVTVGSGPAAGLTATGHRVTILVPAGVPAGVTLVTATNPGGRSGAMAFRVQGPEVCGNETDDDCNGVVDDPAVCVPVSHAPVADAGPAQTAAVGTTVVLDGTGSQDADGDPRRPQRPDRPQRQDEHVVDLERGPHALQYGALPGPDPRRSARRLPQGGVHAQPLQHRQCHEHPAATGGGLQRRPPRLFLPRQAGGLLRRR